MAHGKDAVFWLDNVAGTLTDISTYVKNVSGLPGSVDMAETTTFGKEDKTYEPGLGDAAPSVEAVWNSTLKGILGTKAEWKAGTRSFEYGPDGGTGGKVKYSGECWIQTVDDSSPVGDIVNAAISLQVSDAITEGVF